MSFWSVTDVDLDQRALRPLVAVEMVAMIVRAADRQGAKE